MTTKHDLQDWVRQALNHMGGRGTLTQVAKEIWRARESELRSSGDLFYTWQYDMRWAANHLRRKGIMKSVSVSPTGIWELVSST
jgi:hypothetical protein